MQAFPGRASRFVLGAFLIVALLGAPEISAQSRFRPPPAYVQVGEPDQAEGASILSEFRALGIAGDYALDFDLRVMPRRGPERSIRGRMIGSRDGNVNLTRIKFDGSTATLPKALLLRSGAAGGIWALNESSDDPSKMTDAEMFHPISGTELTAFDLQMPFLHWPDALYEGLAKLRGRPAHQFIVYPPSEVVSARPEISGVRFLLDAQFNGLVQAEQLGDTGKALKTITVLELKKTQEQWIVKVIDVRNDLTRDKTRFRVTAAALGLSFPLVFFQPAHLSLSTPEIPGERFENFR